MKKKIAIICLGVQCYIGLLAILLLSECVPCNAESRITKRISPESPMRKSNQKNMKKVNPNPGYEPYWENGEWVFSGKRTTNVMTTYSGQATIPTTEKSKYTICGQPCPAYYITFGQVCGRQGEQMHNQDKFHNFENYCHLLDRNCGTAMPKWSIVHKGKCTYQKPTPWPHTAQDVHKRKDIFIKAAEMILAGASADKLNAHVQSRKVLDMLELYNVIMSYYPQINSTKSQYEITTSYK